MSEIITLDHDMEGATTMHTVRMIGDTLETYYPGWLWFVEVKGGIASIKSMHANPKYAYVLRLLSGFYSASDLKRQVIHAGGELLERLNMPRNRADWDKIQATASDPRGFLEYQA